MDARNPASLLNGSSSPPSTPNLNIELFGKLGACFPECPKSCTTSPAVNIEIRGSRGCHDGVALVVGQLGWCRISGIHRLRLSVPNHFWDFGSSRFELSVRACCYCTCVRASVSRRRCDWACADVCVYIYTHIRTALIGTHTLCKRYHVFSCLTSRRNSKRD